MLIALLLVVAHWTYAPPTPAFGFSNSHGSGIPDNSDTDSEYDDEDDPNPDANPCAGPRDVGDALHMRVTTGNIWTRVPILRTYANNATELNFELRYDSIRATEDSPLGYGWTHSYNVFVTDDGNHTNPGRVIYTEGNARRNEFTSAPSGYTAPMGRYLELTWEPSSNTYSVKYPNGTVVNFGQALVANPNVRMITSIVDRRGRETTFEYDENNHSQLTTITSPQGRVVTLTYYPGTNLLETVTDPDSQVTTFTYENGTLSSVGDPLGHTQEFDYVSASDHRMTVETLKNEKSYTAEYGDNWRAIRDMDDNTIVSLAPDTGVILPANRTVFFSSGWLTLTDGRNKVWRIRRDNLGRLREVESPDENGGFFTRRYEYGPDPFDLNEPDQRVWSRNRLTRVVNERGDAWTTRYDQLGNIIQRADEAGHVEVFEYEGPVASQMTRRYVDTVSDGHKNEWVYTYYTNDDPSGTAYKTGDLQSVADPIIESPDNVTSYTYESASGGRINAVTATDRNGHVTRYEYYDAADPCNVVYVGNVARVIRDPGGQPDHLNLITKYTYDNMGRPCTKSVQRDAQTTTLTEWTWDAMGRLLSARQDMGETDLEEGYTYDEHGNLTDIVNPRGVVTHYAFDNRNRLEAMAEGVSVIGPSWATTWELDGNGNVTSVTETGGRTATYEYNNQNFLKKITDAGGYVTEYELDPVGMVTTMRRTTQDTGVYVVGYTYDAINRVETMTIDPADPCNPSGHLNLLTRYEYTPPGGCSFCGGYASPGAAQPSMIVDPAGKYTYFQYDAANRLTGALRKVGDESENPDQDDAWTRYELDPVGNVLEYYGPAGEHVSFQYDAANRRTSARAHPNPDPADYFEYTYTYDGAGNLKTLTQPDGNVREMTYDFANRVEQIADSLGMVAAFTYDENGNVATRSTGLAGQTWTFDYDNLDRVTAIKDPIVETPDQYTTVQYIDADREIVATNAKDVQTRRQFDKLSRLITLTENYGGSDGTANTVTSYGYNGVRQTSITDHDGNMTTYQYDNALRLRYMKYADHPTEFEGQVEYNYDAAGNLTYRKDQRDIVTTYTYNDLHHLTGRTYSTGRSETFEIDKAGRLHSAANNDFTAEFDYDIVDRLSEARQIFGSGSPYTIGYDYFVPMAYQDPNDTYVRLTYPGGRQVKAVQDGRMRLKTVVGGLASGAPVGAAWTFDDGNRRETAVMGNGVQSAFTYDLDNRLTSVQHAREINLDPFYYVDYGYDAVGNRLWKHDNLASRSDRNETYEYDQRDRLIGFKRGSLDPQDPDPSQIVTPSADAEMPNRQDWLNLDRRGNWLSYESQIQESTGSQTRTLANPGGAMNEYERIDLHVGGMHSIQQANYDPAGNLVAMELYGDMNCDGQTTSADINAFVLFLTNPTVWHATYQNCDSTLGDVNGDGQSNFADINAFVGLLQGQILEARRYEYDEENRLTAVKKYDETPLLEMKYDALGRRVETIDYTDTRTPCGFTYAPVTTRHVFSGLQPITEYVKCSSETGNEFILAREFVWGGGGTEPIALIDWTAYGDKPVGVEEVLHYSQDELGNVVALTDAGDPDAEPDPVPPAVVERYEYDPYGRTYIESGDSTVRRAVSKYGNPFAWTGQRYDAGVKLYGFFARAYSPELGRWLQRDPLGFVDGVNLYEYVQSAPTVLTDPLGLLSLIPGFSDGNGGDAGGGGGGGGAGALDPPPWTSPCLGLGNPLDGLLWDPIEAFGGRLSRSAPPPPPPPPTEPPVLWLSPGWDPNVWYSMKSWKDWIDIDWGEFGRSLKDRTQGTLDGIGRFVTRGHYRRFGDILGRTYDWDRRVEAAGYADTIIGVTAMLISSGVCFTEDTPVLTPDGLEPIQTIDVGQRVLTPETFSDPEVAIGGECGVTAVDPATWRLVTLKLPNPDGSGDIIDIRSLRSPEWLVETGAEPGGWILFGLPEIGVVGPAYVVTVEPCPPVEAGPGRVVLATVTHYNSFVLWLWVAGLDEPLEPTAEHPLYSEDRQAWVPAGELCVGELLRTAAGPAAVAAVERRPGTHRVYNLEVEGEHCYFVGASGVLSHNVLGCILRIGAQYGLGELTAGISEATGVPEELVQLGLGGVVRGTGKVRARGHAPAAVDGNKRRYRQGDLPAKGKPNSTDVVDRGNGKGTIREYGPDGRAVRDYDFGHDHGSGDPHAHDWDWTRRRSRGPHRPLNPGE